MQSAWLKIIPLAILLAPASAQVTEGQSSAPYGGGRIVTVNDNTPPRLIQARSESGTLVLEWDDAVYADILERAFVQGRVTLSVNGKKRGLRIPQGGFVSERRSQADAAVLGSFSIPRRRSWRRSWFFKG